MADTVIGGLRMSERSYVPLIGVVVIGRNEGERLKRCLQSVVGQAQHIVYVDSGSIDGSVAFAQSLGVEVIALDTSKPFTMARGRNTGAFHLINTVADLKFIQFVDGDCEFDRGWMDKACRALLGREDVAVVCGRRRERYPEASIYNRVIDMEWNTPIGEAIACGGDSMMRATTFQQVGGFNETMIAGEEPELCVRFRQAGCVILRIDAAMTLHDAAITRFGQWWKRAVRGGHAYAEGAAMHGSSPERHKVRQVQSVLTYGMLLPAFAIFAAVLAAMETPWWALVVAVVLAAYVILWWRILVLRSLAQAPLGDRVFYATFCVLGKIAEFQGVMTYVFNRVRGRRTVLLEYKRTTVCESHP